MYICGIEKKQNMTSDNNKEMFPIVDEEGNITGAATRGECHNGSKLLHPVVHLHTCTYSIAKENCSCKSVPNGKTYSRANGTPR